VTPYLFGSLGRVRQGQHAHGGAQFDVSNGTRHFVDSFTTFNRTITSVANPCAGYSCGAPTTASIPPDTSVPPAGRPAGVFTAYNATITNVAPYTWAGEVRQVELTYTVASGASKDVIIAVGAHLARQNEWGTGNGAAGYPGGSGKIAARFDTTKSDVAASVNPGSAVSPGATISGTVVNDANGNGSTDAGEVGIGGVAVASSGALSDTAVTGADGKYTFSDLSAGTYGLDYTLPTGFENTGVKPLSGVVVEGDSSTVTGKDFFAQQRNASISGTVYNDVDGDGQLDAGESGISGVAVTRSGSTTAKTTDANGAYTFTGLAAGTYTVDYSVPAGYVNTGTKPSASFSVAAGQTVTGKNFFARAAAGSISGTVYDDADDSGTLTTGDAGKGGVTVFIDANGNGTLDAGERNTTSSTLAGSVGTYSFSSVSTGSHTVSYAVPAGYANTGARPVSVNVTTGNSSTANFFAIRTTSTTVTTSSSPSTSTYGTSVTFTATVTSAAGNPNSVGTVTFRKWRGQSLHRRQLEREQRHLHHIRS
jgi:uncharacterized protein (DUF2141 family)